MHVFSNNARTTLAQPLSANYGDKALVCDAGGSAETFAPISYVDDGSGAWYDHDYQMATLTNPSMPGVYEIVVITQRVGPAFTVIRGHEDTAPVAWPVGTVIEARITAGMLRSFPQADTDAVLVAGADGVRFAGSAPFNVRGRLSVGGQQSDLVQVAGWPVLQLARANEVAPYWRADSNLSHSVVGGTPILSLGDTATWSGNTVYAFQVIKPSVPDGYQYCLEPKNPMFGAQASGVEPAFTADGWAFEVGGGASGGTPAYFVPVPDPVDITIDIPHDDEVGLVVTEIGFLCTRYTPGSTPVISAGTYSDPTAFVSAVALSAITDAGHFQRMVVSHAGGALAKKLRFVLNTPGTGVFEGRFFWRGFLMEFGT